MVSATVVFTTFLAVSIVCLVSSRMIYTLCLSVYAVIKMKRLGYQLKDIPISLDKLVYMISLPTYKSDIISAAEEQYRTVADYDSVIYPQLRGIQVILKTKGEQLIAYLPVNEFRLPFLDQLLSAGYLTTGSYRRIIEYMLIMPSTSDEIIAAVYKQVQKKRFS